MALRLILQSLAMILIVSLLGVAMAHAASFEGDVIPWKWTKSQCQNCPIMFETKHPYLESEQVQKFIRTLESEKFELIKLYGSDPQEYNLLAQMAIGILGQESQFFRSWRYKTKEELQWSVSLAKSLKVMITPEEDRASLNSRGPTQIKIIPAKIAAHYGITPNNVEEPENAALATMGYLIEALRELKQRAKNNKLEFVTKATYVDYLPYIYFGKSRSLIERTVTPNQNKYVRAMKNYMSWVRIHEVQVSN